jgi:pimeloyl-ACP methyl ester carboxylesterase
LIQVNILEQLSSLARSGKYTGSVAKPKSIVLLGHSFGSFISNALVVTQPGAADALLLTGMAYSGYNPQVILEAFNPRVASLQSPKKFGDRDAGYITNVDVIANVNKFVLFSIDASPSLDQRQNRN